MTDVAVEGLRALCLALDLPAEQAAPVAAIRVGGPCPPSLAPRLQRGKAIIVRGGHDLTGRPLAPLDLSSVRRFAADCGLTDFAVTATGSPVLADHELQVAAAIADEVPGARITLSYEYGRCGLREREQWAIGNAALCPYAAHLADQAARRFPHLPLYFCRTDDGLVSAHYFRRYPLSCAEGATAALHRGLQALTDRQALTDQQTLTDRQTLPGQRSPHELGAPLRVQRGALHGTAWPTPEQAAAFGAPLTAPMAAVERIVRARGTAELDNAVADAQDEALARVISAGAAPGSAHIAATAVNPLSYLPDGLYRLRISARGATP
ncbi:hypothetical protein [Nonomuraea sp. NPDC049141]|uniref:hypothetical protein n=1 Tax=Nonomuraea sp. NPDC049141 TaxID=3155500 RepID=UPI0033D29973